MDFIFFVWGVSHFLVTGGHPGSDKETKKTKNTIEPFDDFN